MRAGLYGTVPPLPYSPGFEVAGRVVRVGSQVSEWQEGDRAAALVRYGGYAHDLIIPAEHLFRQPDSLTATESAATPWCSEPVAAVDQRPCSSQLDMA
jgi:NADPH2:quinone reductase